MIPMFKDKWQSKENVNFFCLNNYCAVFCVVLLFLWNCILGLYWLRWLLFLASVSLDIFAVFWLATFMRLVGCKRSSRRSALCKSWKRVALYSFYRGKWADLWQSQKTSHCRSPDPTHRVKRHRSQPSHHQVQVANRKECFLEPGIDWEKVDKKKILATILAMLIYFIFCLSFHCCVCLKTCDVLQYGGHVISAISDCCKNSHVNEKKLIL